MRLDSSPIGNRVKFYREKLGISQKELSKRAGVSQSYIFGT